MEPENSRWYPNDDLVRLEEYRRDIVNLKMGAHSEDLACGLANSPVMKHSQAFIKKPVLMLNSQL